MTGFTVLDYSRLVRKALVLLSELKESDFDGETSEAEGDCRHREGTERTPPGADGRRAETATVQHVTPR